MANKKKKEIQTRRNRQVLAMIQNPRRNTCHTDKKKEEQRTLARKKVRDPGI